MKAKITLMIFIVVAYLLVMAFSSMTMFAYEESFSSTADDYYNFDSMSLFDKCGYVLYFYAASFPLCIPFWFIGNYKGYPLLLFVPNLLLVCTVFYIFLRRQSRTSKYQETNRE